MMTPPADPVTTSCRVRRALRIRAPALVIAASAVLGGLGPFACSEAPPPPAISGSPSAGEEPGAAAPSPAGAPPAGDAGRSAPDASASVEESGADPPGAQSSPAAVAGGQTTVPPAADAPTPDAHLPQISASVEVDESNGELRVPCIFVNPTQALEVFACHWSGPAHEAVVAFLAEGKTIFEGLRRLGLRSPKFWNASSRVAQGRPDVRYTLGDRVVVLLSWKWNGEPHLLPAEKILREIGTGFAPFIRGFTFSAQEVPLGDPPQPGIPPHVEITIGGPTRGEKAITSVLFHPNDLRELTRWMAPVEIDPGVVPDLKELVEEAVPCTLVLKRVAGEAALLDLALKYESDPARVAFLGSLRPVAEEIDRRKAEYAETVQRIIDLTAEGEKAGADPDALTATEKELRAMIGGGRLERAVLGIWKLYLKLFLAQEDFRRRALEAAGLPELQLEQVRRLNERLAFEPRFVDLELQLLDLQTREEPLSEEDRLLAEAFDLELEQRRNEAELPLARLNLADISRRLKELDPDDDAWSFRVQEEYRREILAGIRHLKSRATELSTRVRENRARAAGEWPALRETVLAERTRALAGVKLAELERELVEVDRDLRWSSHDIGSDRITDEKKVAIREKLDGLKERREELLREIAGKRSELEADGESAPGPASDS